MDSAPRDLHATSAPRRTTVPRQEFICDRCGQPFTLLASTVANRTRVQYCSRECRFPHATAPSVAPAWVCCACGGEPTATTIDTDRLCARCADLYYASAMLPFLPEALRMDQQIWVTRETERLGGRRIGNAWDGRRRAS